MGAATRLLSTHDSGILFLTLQSEDGLPRLARSVLMQIETEIVRLQTERDCKGCIVTGTPRAFAVGADISEICRLSPAEAYDFSRYGQELCRAVERSRVSVVAAIRGYCMAAGWTLRLRATHESRLPTRYLHIPAVR